VIPRKTFDNDLCLLGYGREQVHIYSQAKSFIDIEIFNDWFKDTFVPEVVARRARSSYQGPAYLIMDNCTAHRGHIFETLCAENNIIPVPLPPDSSNQLQPLDLSLFGATKRHILGANRHEEGNLQSRHICEVLTGFLSAAVPPSIVASFRNGGISLVLEGNEPRSGRIPNILCRITPESARCLLEPVTDLAMPLIRNPAIEDHD
jgi:hypothetical protein